MTMRAAERRARVLAWAAAVVFAWPVLPSLVYPPDPAAEPLSGHWCGSGHLMGASQRNWFRSR